MERDLLGLVAGLFAPRMLIAARAGQDRYRLRREYNLGCPRSAPGQRLPATTVMTKGLSPEVACRVAACQLRNARLRRAEVTR